MNQVQTFTGTELADRFEKLNQIGIAQLLESLPWPRHLKNVPDYAGGHHERMGGKGHAWPWRSSQCAARSMARDR